LTSGISFFLGELKRRKVFRVAAVYVGVGLGVLGAAELILDPLGLGSLRPYIVILVGLGFPIALVLAWAHEVRPDSGTSATADQESVRAPTSTQPSGQVERRDPSRRPHPEDGQSVAVLPFENMSGETEEAYFADGMAEELINALAKQPGLRVAARTSAFAFRGERIDVREIAARLNVSHVIEGSVRRFRGTLRITAQLIDGVDGYHLWSQTFDRDAGDVFRVQEEIADSVVGKLRGGGATEVKAEFPATKLSAYEAFLRGKHALAAFGPRSLRRAIEEFEACIRIDDTYAPAFAGLADALTSQSIGFSDRPAEESMGRAGEAVQCALELDPDLAEGYFARALVRMWYEFDYEGAKDDFDRALAINPNFADAYLWLEFYWTYVRIEYEEALAANRKASRLSPLDSRAAVRLGTLQMLFGRLEEAEASHREVLVENPEDGVSHLGLGDTLFRLGRQGESLFHLEEALRLGGRPTPWLGICAGFLGAAGEKTKAKEILAELEERAREGYVSGFWMGVALGGLGRYPEAFSQLDRAVQERDSNLLYLFAVPRGLGLHDRPESPSVLDRIGLGHLMAHLPERT
jgi:TolB-like protein/cytochrome c-type biogenesis protein CcmH/NrfG